MRLRLTTLSRKPAAPLQHSYLGYTRSPAELQSRRAAGETRQLQRNFPCMQTQKETRVQLCPGRTCLWSAAPQALFLATLKTRATGRLQAHLLLHTVKRHWRAHVMVVPRCLRLRDGVPKVLALVHTAPTAQQLLQRANPSPAVAGIHGRRRRRGAVARTLCGGHARLHLLARRRGICGRAEPAMRSAGRRGQRVQRQNPSRVCGRPQAPRQACWPGSALVIHCQGPRVQRLGERPPAARSRDRRDLNGRHASPTRPVGACDTVKEAPRAGRPQTGG